MNFIAQTTSYFDVAAKRLGRRYKSFADDYDTFLEEIKKNPYQGVELMPGVRKIRMSITSKERGKSGGARVITFTYAVSDKAGVILLLLVYDKSDASSVKNNVLKAILKDLGFNLNQLQLEGKLKPIPLEQDSIEAMPE